MEQKTRGNSCPLSVFTVFHTRSSNSFLFKSFSDCL